MLAVSLVLSVGCGEGAGPVAPPIVEPPARPLPAPPTNPGPPGPENIYIARADGSVAARLVSGAAPDWSPDGQRIAFHRDGDVRVVKVDGSSDIQLAKGSHPSWSPDGTRLVFRSTDGIRVMNADGSAASTILRHDFQEPSPEMGIGHPVWSPDGTRIAFLHLGDGDFLPAQAYVMRSDGSDPRVLVGAVNRFTYAESDPSWSPDGSKIVFWSYGFGIAVVSSQGGVPVPLYADFPAVAYGAKPAWSPGGSTIVFNSGKFSTTRQSILSMSSTGGAAKVLISDAYDGAWSPDGARIAFVSTRSP